MITVYVHDSGKNSAEQFVENLRTLCQHAAEAGLWADVVSEKTLTAAWVNEFGAAIRKTPKMQRFLRAMARKHGIKLDPAKGRPGYVVIPPRPFIRRAIDRHVDQVLSEHFLELALRDALKGVRAMAIKMEQLIKLEINYVNEPPLHPLTIAMKGGDKPLVHTGTLRRSVRFGVVRLDGTIVERGTSGG